ncbi:MAG: alpha/beta hydrolase [Acetobacter sp.]|nr:alpha/beta hydrolase [Acetobacter sp.]
MMTHCSENLFAHDHFVDGTRFRVAGPRDSVKGTLVFLHGVGMRLEFWAPQIAEFSRSYQCIAYDMLGHGESELPRSSPALSDYSAQFETLVAHLHLGPVTMIGHSMGALIATDAALRYPDRIQRLIAMNGVYSRSPEQKSAIERRAAMLDDAMPDWSTTLARWFGDDASPSSHDKKSALLDLLNRNRPEGYVRTYRLFASSDEAHKGRLSQLVMPALFLTGEFDPNSTPAMSKTMALESTNGSAEILPGERHMMSFVNPHATNLAIHDFLNITQ